MPRRNENARPRDHAGYERWRISELRTMSDMVDRKTEKSIDADKQRQPPESISERIVRDFRKNEGLDLAKSMIPLKPISKIRPYLGIRWYEKVNWRVVFDWACLIAAVIAIMMILGLILFGPFNIKKVLE